MKDIEQIRAEVQAERSRLDAVTRDWQQQYFKRRDNLTQSELHESWLLLRAFKLEDRANEDREDALLLLDEGLASIDDVQKFLEAAPLVREFERRVELLDKFATQEHGLARRTEKGIVSEQHNLEHEVIKREYDALLAAIAKDIDQARAERIAQLKRMIEHHKRSAKRGFADDAEIAIQACEAELRALETASEQND